MDRSQIRKGQFITSDGGRGHFVEPRRRIALKDFPDPGDPSINERAVEALALERQALARRLDEITARFAAARKKH